MSDIGVDPVVGDSRTLGARDLHNFLHQRAEQLHAFRIVEDLADPPPCQRRHGVERAVPHQLVPSERHDVGNELAEYSGALEDSGDCLGALALTAVELAEVDVAGAQMRDFTWRENLDSDSRIAAHHQVAAKNRGEVCLVLDTVLNGKNRTARLEASFDRARGRGSVVSLDAEQDQIVGRKIARLISSGDFDFQIAADAHDVESMFANRAQMLAPRA